jgi:hypothetical protein
MKPSVLELDYVSPKRPYSQNELTYLRNKLRRDLRISSIQSKHAKCGHCYYVKENSKKAKEILEKNDPDCGNCSVCWKLFKTPKSLKSNAMSLVNEYMRYLEEDDESIKQTYDMIDVENCFYKWLYIEFAT